MLEDKTSHLALSGGDPEVRLARVLSTKHLKLPRKRRGAPKYVRELARLIQKMASEKEAPLEFSMVELKIWEVLLRFDEHRKKYRQEEGKLRRAQEKSR